MHPPRYPLLRLPAPNISMRPAPQLLLVDTLALSYWGHTLEFVLEGFGVVAGCGEAGVRCQSLNVRF